MNAESQIQLGNDLFAHGDLEGARSRYEAALAAEPGHARAHYNLGVVLQRLERPRDAMHHYAAAVEAQPTLAKALVNWGNAHKDLGELEAAAALYRRALAIDPDDVHGLNNLASIAQERGDLDEAERLYQRAAKSDERLVDARYNLAVIALRRGDFARGWEGYELRFRTRPAVVSLPPYALPLAGKEDLLPGRRIAVAREPGEGLGDELLFATLLPDLRATGVAAVVETDPRLVEAFRRSVPGIRFVAPVEAGDAFRSCERLLPLGSLARHLRPTRGDFARQPAALLWPDPARVAEMRARLGAGTKVGISWRSFQGRGRKHVENRKSVELERFGILDGHGARLVDLQYGEVAGEREAFDAAHPGLRQETEGLDRFNDLEGLLAAIAACDLVVTTSNVTAHLAGAIGRSTWLLYPAANAPFHYWVPGSDGRSPWYPSVEIVTDAGWSDWPAVFEAVATRLKRRLAE